MVAEKLLHISDKLDLTIEYPENPKNTDSVIRSLFDSENREASTQGAILEGLRNAFNSIMHVSCDLHIYKTEHGTEDGTLTVSLPVCYVGSTPLIRKFRIGCECKRTETVKKSKEDTLNMCFCQNVCYITDFMNSMDDYMYDIILGVTDKYIGIALLSDNRDVFDNLVDYISENDIKPNKVWDNKNIRSIGNRIKWTVIDINSDFRFTDIVKVLINLLLNGTVN